MSTSLLRALIGPTASGKESTALAVAARAPVEILSMDSMKVYRDMFVGTAKASAAVRARVPHHLVDIADPGDSFSTREWLDAAVAAIDEIRSRGRHPLLSGGTALYLKAILYGLFDGPAADPAVRRRLREHSGEELHRMLSSVDPKTAGKVHPNDVRRLIRALEVFEITGRKVSDLRREWERDRPVRDVRIVGIRRERADLFERINVRVDRMIDAGLVDEVRGLLDRGELGPIARQAHGYKEIAAYLEGTVGSLEEAVDLLKRSTRLFSRRQMTWFKHFDVAWVDAGPEDAAEEIAEQVVERLFPEGLT